jgi:hypothetical protein
LSFNTQNTKSFIHAEQYGKKKKRIKTQVAKLLSTAKTSQITTIKPLSQKTLEFKNVKQPKLKKQRRFK